MQTRRLMQPSNVRAGFDALPLPPKDGHTGCLREIAGIGAKESRCRRRSWPGALPQSVGSHAGAVRGEYSREHEGRCRPGLHRRRACRQLRERRKAKAARPGLLITKGGVRVGAGTWNPRGAGQLLTAQDARFARNARVTDAASRLTNLVQSTRTGREGETLAYRATLERSDDSDAETQEGMFGCFGSSWWPSTTAAARSASLRLVRRDSSRSIWKASASSTE
jgi:hypothetical protein